MNIERHSRRAPMRGRTNDSGERARRRAASAGALLLGMAAFGAAAQTFPAKPVTIVVPFPAGGLTDMLARGLGERLSTAWGQPVIVENRPGANTIIAADAVSRAPADGHTLLMANDPTLSSNQYLYNKLPYDPVADFTPVINLVKTEPVLTVNAKSPYQSLEDLIEAARRAPDSITYGSFGVGSKAHLDIEALARRTGVSFHHIPYKGISDVMVALAGGQIDFTLSGTSGVIPFMQDGRVRGLAIAAPERRTAIMPDVPTFAEKGLPDFQPVSWFGLAVPQGTPQPVIDRIAADVGAILEQPDFRQRYITGVGLQLLNQPPEEFTAFLEKDRAAYKEVIATIGVKLD